MHINDEYCTRTHYDSETAFGLCTGTLCTAVVRPELEVGCTGRRRASREVEVGLRREAEAAGGCWLTGLRL